MLQSAQTLEFSSSYPSRSSQERHWKRQDPAVEVEEEEAPPVVEKIARLADRARPFLGTCVNIITGQASLSQSASAIHKVQETMPAHHALMEAKHVSDTNCNATLDYRQRTFFLSGWPCNVNGLCQCA